MSKNSSRGQDKAPSSSGSGTPWIVRFFLKLFVLGTGLAASGVLLLLIALSIAWPNLPDLTAMTDYRPRVPLRVFTADKF